MIDENLPIVMPRPRREGKTITCIQHAINMVNNGRNVIITSFNNQALKQIIAPSIQRELDRKEFKYKYSKSDMHFLIGMNHIKLLPESKIAGYRSSYFNYYIIYDELILPDADFITVTGDKM